MKKFARPLLVAALSCTTPAFAAVYTDSSMNYPDGWITGANGGEGFAAWILTSTPGNGWSGSGIWSGADAELTGNVLDLNKNAFGFVAKGENSSFTASRNFRAALDPDDSFEFDMAVNWDCGDNPDSRKGIVLLAGDTEILTINHDSFPGPISINGQHHDNPALTNYGTSTMHWTIRATSPTELAVTTTARDGLSPPFTTNLPVPSSALSGFRLQSIGQVNDTTENHAKRQTYFNHFTLTIARPLPELYSLTLTENNGTWAITNAAPTPLSFTLTRSSADDEAHVSLASSDPAFVSLPNPSLTFPPGTASATFTATAKIYTNGNVSSISASALGYNSPNPWDLKGPAYLISANSTTYPDAPWQINQDDTSSLSLHNSQAHWFPGDDTLVTLSPEDNAILSVASLDPWTPVENGTLATATISGLAAGSSLVNVYYDLVKIGDYRFTVIEPPNPIAISGPHSLRIGTTGLYQIITTDIEGESLLVTLSNPSIATASPETLTPYTPSETNAVLLSPLAVGTTSLTVGNEDVGFASFPISIHPSTADCIAYDDAANPSYLDGFTLAPDPIGIRGFDPWRILEQTTAAGDVNGAKITTTIPTTGAISAILENNRTFSAYAYGPSATSTFSLYRPFGQPLAPGQEFTMDIGTHYRDGAKNFTLVNDCNNAQYPRFSFFIAGDAYGVDIHGLTNAHSLNWPWQDSRTVRLSCRLSPDATTYTFTLASGNDLFSTNVPTSANDNAWTTGIHGIIIRVWNGGEGIENESFFNRLAIEQFQKTTPPRIPKITCTPSSFSFMPPDGFSIPTTGAVKYATEIIQGAWAMTNLATYTVTNRFVEISLPTISNASVIFGISFTPDPTPTPTPTPEPTPAP